MGGYIMKTAILGSALLFAISLSAPAAEKDLYGTWKMVSQSQKVVDTGEVRAGRGAAPNGYVTFTPDGRVMGIILSDKRPRPESVAKLTDQQRIELFNTMNAYAGTYKLEGNKLTYNYDLTHNGITARAAVREIKIEGRKITMVNEPGRAVADGKMAITTTVWEKVQAPTKK
jgi:lipocalin-like protein